MSKFDDFLKPDKEKEHEPVVFEPIKEDEDIEKKIDETIAKKTPTTPPPIVKEKIKRKPKAIYSDKNKTKFTPEDRQKIIKKYLGDKRVKFSRRERKLIENMEHDTSKTTQNTVIWLTAIACFFILYMYLYMYNDYVFLLVVMIGSIMFLPVGMLLGWITFDPYMRCKVLRKITKKNYGILHFVGKGGKMVPKIKNFDQGLIWKEDECWVIAKDFVYQITKDGNKINEGKRIDPRNIVTLIDTVPTVFVDIDSFEPLRLSSEEREPVNPLEIGSVLKAWVDNQKAKILAGRGRVDIFIIATLLMSIVAVIISVMVLSRLDELKSSLSVILSMVQFLG